MVTEPSIDDPPNPPLFKGAGAPGRTPRHKKCPHPSTPTPPGVGPRWSSLPAGRKLSQAKPWANVAVGRGGGGLFLWRRRRISFSWHHKAKRASLGQQVGRPVQTENSESHARLVCPRHLVLTVSRPEALSCSLCLIHRFTCSFQKAPPSHRIAAHSHAYITMRSKEESIATATNGGHRRA